MNIKVDPNVSKNISSNINTSGNMFTSFSSTSVSGGNTSEASLANSLVSNMQSILSRYKSVVQRDAEHISTLANNFVETDKSLKDSITFGK